MKITVRMDDITPDMDWESFEAFLEMFRRYDIRPLLGIVPLNKDSKLQIDAPDPLFFRKMKQLQQEGYCLAMHGCYHVYETACGGCFPLNPQSEFAGRSEQEQRELLTKGKALLEKEGIHTDIFMAPGHTLDRTTVKILKELGFSYITDGYGNAPYKRWGMTWLPISVLQRWLFSDKKGTATLVIHANNSSKQVLEAHEKIFAQNQGNFLPYSALLEMEAKEQTICARMTEYLLALGKQWAARLIRALRAKRRAI